MRGTEAGVRTAVLATTPPGNTVQSLSLPALRPRNPSLLSKLPPNFAQLDVVLRSQVLEAERRQCPDTGLSSSSPKFKFPVARVFFLHPSTAPGLGGFLWGKDPA